VLSQFYRGELPELVRTSMWRRGFRVLEAEGLSRDHAYKAIAWLGEPIGDDRSMIDAIEEALYRHRQPLCGATIRMRTLTLIVARHAGQGLVPACIRIGVSALCPVEHGQVVQRHCDIGVLGAERLLADGQRAPVERLGFAFRLPLKGEVGDIRAYIVPERIDVMTMRSFTPHREEDGSRVDDSV